VEEQEFRRIALEELSAVYRLAVHLCLNPVDAEDLVQDTYVRAFQAAASFTLGAHGIRPWLFKILNNLFRSRLERQRLEPVAVEQPEAHATNAGDAPPATAGQDLSDLDWEQVDGRLRDAIDALPYEQKVVFLLWAVEDLKYREIADVLGMPIGTVMSRLHRARSTLLAQLADLAAEVHVPGKRGAARGHSGGWMKPAGGTV